jgi:two-component system, NtrC family, sensor kinase
MHRLLARQLKRHVPADVDLSPFSQLLAAIDDAYAAADADRALLERSIELASKELYEQNRRLEEDLKERRRLELELGQGERLRAVGQLAAGIAHEINTPVQFVGDNARFVKGAFEELTRLLDRSSAACASLQRGSETTPELDSLRRFEAELDLPELQNDVGSAFEGIQEGVKRVTEIVSAMKEFGHTSQRQVVVFDVNRCITNTLAVARNEIKHVADVELDLAELPTIPCNPGELHQVFLNLIVNAAHAIGGALGTGRERGRIRIRSSAEADSVVVQIRDDGPGMPPSVAGRAFEPFFTTKEVGRGTGQGLPIARAIVVNKHAGSLTFTTEVGVGTSFEVRLPVHGAPETTATAPDSPRHCSQSQ